MTTKPHLHMPTKLSTKPHVLSLAAVGEAVGVQDVSYYVLSLLI
jgi:hypothetical protein